MNYLKFILLAVGCTAGFIGTGYSSLAKDKGWSVRSYFSGLSFITVVSFVLEIGCTIISAFVNPWWTSLLVVVTGFTGFMLICSVFKFYSQLVGGILILFSLISIPLYVFRG